MVFTTAHRGTELQFQGESPEARAPLLSPELGLEPEPTGPSAGVPLHPQGTRLLRLGVWAEGAALALEHCRPGGCILESLESLNFNNFLLFKRSLYLI